MGAVKSVLVTAGLVGVGEGLDGLGVGLGVFVCVGLGVGVLVGVLLAVGIALTVALEVGVGAEARVPGWGGKSSTRD